MVSEEFRHLDTNIVLALVKARSDFNSIAVGAAGNSLNYAKDLGALYSYFKWEAPMYWETNVKQYVLADLPALMASSSASRGPVSLRKAAGSSVNMIFINLAKQNLPTLRYSRAFKGADPEVEMHTPSKARYSVGLGGVIGGGDGDRGGVSSRPQSVVREKSSNSFLVQTSPTQISYPQQVSTPTASIPSRLESHPEESPEVEPVSSDASSTRTWSSFLTSTATAVVASATAAGKAKEGQQPATDSSTSRPMFGKVMSTRFW